MEDLINYIRRTAMLRSYDLHEGNEVIQLMYGFIIGSVRAQADKLVITSNNILYIRGVIPVDQIDISSHEQNCARARGEGRSDCTSFREALSLILKYDERLRHYIYLIEETPEAVTYRVIFEQITNVDHDTVG